MKKPLCLVIFSLAIGLVGYSLRLEHQLLEKTGRFKNPTLYYTHTNLVQDYLHHSEVLRQGIKKGNDCIRPFYIYYNTQTYNDEQLIKQNKCTELSAENILALTVKNKEPLGVYDAGRRVVREGAYGQLKFANNEIIVEQHAIHVEVIPDNSDEEPKTLDVNFQYKPLDRHVPCQIDVQVNNNPVKFEKNCQDHFTQIDVFKNSKEKIAVLTINARDKKVEFQSLKKSSWEGGSHNWVVNSALCENTQNKKTLTYRHDKTEIRLSCHQQALLDSESQRLAALFAKQSQNKPDVVSTLDKELTAQTDRMTKKYCPKDNCQTKILVMKTQTGEILALSAHQGKNRSQQAKDKIVVANFQREPAGSVVKPIFAQAVLTQNIALKDLEINNVVAGSEFQGKKLRTGRLVGYDDTSRHLINIYNASYGNYDFNRFLRDSNNVYASSLFFLANFHMDKKNLDNEKSLPIKGFKVVGNDVKLPNATKDYAGHLAYYPLLSSKEQSSTNAQRAYASDDDMPEWLRTLNGYGIKFSHKQANKFGNYRQYIWGNLGSLGVIRPELSPERESFNDTECITKGYFGCRMYAWTLGEGDSRFSTIALAEMFSSIATDRHIQGSFVPKKEGGSYATDSMTKANLVVRQGMALVIQEGTARALKGHTNHFFIMGKTGTPSVITAQAKDNLSRKKLFVISEAIAPYRYQELLGNLDLQQQLVQKLKLHPYFLKDTEEDITKLLINLLNGDTIQQQGIEDYTKDEKRLVLVVAPKEQVASNPITKGCTIVISAYQQGVDGIHTTIASELLKVFKDNNFLDKCS